jgi:hypothetical protein
MSGVEPFTILLAKAAQRLCPELEPRITSGELSVEDAQPEVARAYWQLLFDLVSLIDNTDNGDREYYE